MPQYVLGFCSPEEREILDKRKAAEDGVTCQRCLEPIAAKKKCQVPHPQHLLDDCGGCSDSKGYQKFSHCEACDKSFTTLFKKNQDPKIIKGPKFCWNGTHRKRALVLGDEQCVNHEILSMKVNKDLQKNIDKALTGNKQKSIYVFNIVSDGFYDESITASVCHPMSNLTKVKLIDVNIQKLHLNEELTPMVKDLELQNVPDDCDFKVTLPRLQNVSIIFFAPDDDGEAVNTMLQAATKLKSFQARKLMVSTELNFASNDLETIVLTRADCTSSITVWAPNLKLLNLACCYDIENIEILKEHPTLSKELPSTHKMSNFSIDLTAATVGPDCDAIKNLRNCGRCDVPANAGKLDIDL